MTRIQPLRRAERIPCSLLIWIIPIFALWSVTLIGQFNKTGFNMGITVNLNVEQFKLPPYDYMKKVEYIANLPVLIKKIKDVDETKYMETKERYEVVCNPSWKYSRAMKMQEPINETNLHPDMFSAESVEDAREFINQVGGEGGVLKPLEARVNVTLAGWLREKIILGSKFKERLRFDSERQGVRYFKQLPFIRQNHVGKHFVDNYLNHTDYEDVVFDFDKMEFNIFNGLVRFSDNSFKDWTVKKYEFYRTCLNSEAVQVHAPRVSNEVDENDLRAKNIRFLALHGYLKGYAYGRNKNNWDQHGFYESHNSDVYNDIQERVFIWRHDLGGFEDVEDPSKYHLKPSLAKAVKDSKFMYALRMKSDLPFLPGKDITEEVLMAEDITDYFDCYNHPKYVGNGGARCDVADAHFYDHNNKYKPRDPNAKSHKQKCRCKLTPNLYTEVVGMLDKVNNEMMGEVMMFSNRFATFMPNTEEIVVQRYDNNLLARNKGMPQFAPWGTVQQFSYFYTPFIEFTVYMLFVFFMPVPNIFRRIKWLEWHKWQVRSWTFLTWFRCYLLVAFMALPNSPLSHYCFTNRRKPFSAGQHGPTADTDQDVPGIQMMGIPSLPGLSCDYAKGIELVWQVQRINYYVFLTTFFWINGSQARAIYNVVYTKVRQPWPAQFRGIKATNVMVLILFPFTLINLVRYEWVSYGREMTGLKTQLMWQEEVNCDMTTKENCMLQGLNSRDHIRFYYDDGYRGKNQPVPFQPGMERYHKDTLFPTDYKGGFQLAYSDVLLTENYVPRGKMNSHLHSKLENQKYFLQNMHRQYANYGILMMMFWVTGFGKNGLLSNKISKIHQHQHRRLILCLCLFVFTTVMRVEFFFAKFYVDKVDSFWVFSIQMAVKVFAKFLPACYMVHLYCGIVARLTTTHNLYKSINLGSLIFKSVWFVLAPAMFLIELKDIQFSGWYFQAARLTQASDAMKLFYETNLANGNHDKTYTAAHFYVPDGGNANVTLNGENNLWPSTFLTDQFSTVVYSMAQTITNTGFGDVVPTSIIEILVACFILLFGWFVLMNRMVDLFYNQLKSSLKVSDEGLGDAGKDFVNQVYDHEELNVFPSGVKKEVDYILMETLCCQNRSKIFSKLRLPELKIMGQGLKFHTLHANDVMEGGDGFVMFIKSGQWELHIVDMDIAIELNYSDHQVFFEQGCVHNQMADYQVICTSEFGEIYTIDRPHLMRTVENVRFGHGKTKCEVEGVVGNFQPLYETKQEKKTRKKEQKEMKKVSTKKVADENVKMTEEEKAKQDNFDMLYEEMKAERKKIQKAKDKEAQEKEEKAAQAKKAANGKVKDVTEKTDAEKEEKKKKKKDKKDKKDKPADGEKTEGEKIEPESGAENAESGEKKKKKKKDKKKDTETEDAPADNTEEVPASAEAAAKSADETDAEDESEKKDKKEKKSKKDKKEKKDTSDDTKDSKKDSKNAKGSKDSDVKKSKKNTKKGQGVFTKMNTKITVGKKKVKTVASDLLEFFPESIELFRWRMFVLVHAVFAFVYTCNKYSFHNSGTEYGKLDWIGMQQSSYWGVYYKFIYPVFFLDFLATLYTGHRDRDNTIVFNPNRQWRRYSWSDLLIKRVFLFSKGVRMLNDEEGMYKVVNQYLQIIPFWPMTANYASWTPDKYAWDPLDPLEIEVFSLNTDEGEGLWAIKKIDRANDEQYYHTMEMMFLGYYYYIILETINSELPRRIGYFKTKIVETCLQVFLLLQVLSTLMYAGSCSTFMDARRRFGVQGPCLAGSWGWLYFDENNLSTELASSNSKWASTFYLNWKIITGFGSSGVTPTYWWTRALLVVSMIAGMLILAKIVALIKFASNSLKTVTFESNWISIEKTLSRVYKTNKDLYNSLYNTKLNSFNNGLFLQYNPAKFKISDIDLFSDIPKIGMERCNEIKRFLSGEPGQVIIQQDTSVDKFYFLNSGDVQVFKNGESCGFLKAGEVFNLNEMFAERENAYEFKVYTEVELYCWEKADLMRVLGTVWEPFTMKMKTVCQEKLDKTSESTSESTSENFTENNNFTDHIKSNHLNNFLKYFYALIALCLGSALIGLLIGSVGSEKVELTFSDNQTSLGWVVKDSWRHQLHSSYNGADYNTVFACLSYWANCVTNNGGFATRFSTGVSFEKLFEFCVHLAGMVLSLMMCMEMSKMSDLTDKIHKSACENLIKIKHMMKSSESGVVEIVEEQVTENLMESFDKKLNSQMFKWLPVQLKSELAKNLYSEILSLTYFNQSEANTLASHVEVIRTVKGTFLFEDQLVDHAYFIAEGGFTVSGKRLNPGSAIVFENQADIEVKSLGKGCVYQIPLKIVQQQAKNDFTNVKYGVFESTNEESVVAISEDNEDTGTTDNWVIKSSVTNSTFGEQELVFACMVSWMISFTNFSRFGVFQDFSDNFVIFDIFYGFAMFGCVWKYLDNKNVSIQSAMASSDKWLFISVIPVMYAPLTSVLRAAIFVSNQTHFYQSTSLGMRNYRLVALFFVYLVFCVFATGLQVMLIDSTAISDKGLFDLEGQVGTDSSTKSSDLIVFLQYFYSTIDSFTATGNNTNLRPTGAFCILLHIISAFLGRIYFVTFLAFGKNLVQERLDNIHIDYIKLQTRIVNYMKVAGCHETALGERKTNYIISTLEGIYQKTKFFDNKVLTENLMPGLKRKFNLFEFGSVMRDNSEIFNGVSDACIVEIADRAMVIEHYFAGNLIQEVSSVFKGYMVVLEGSCYVDNNNLFVKGDCMYDDFLKGVEVRAFSQCKLGLIEHEDLEKILKFYSDDKSTFNKNLEQAVAVMKEEAVLNPIRNILNVEQSKKDKKKAAEKLESANLAVKTFTKAKDLFRIVDKL